MTHITRMETSFQKGQKRMSLYSVCTVVIQDLCTPLNLHKNNQYIACQTLYIVKHFLIKCKDLSLIRCFYNANNMQYLFENVDMNDILSFLREGVCPCGVMVKSMDCANVVCEFILQLRYYIHFRANTLGKGMNPLILPAIVFF